MSDDREGHTSPARAIQYILLFALLVLLPGVQGSVFGWIHFFIPLTVLFYLYKWRDGFRFVLTGMAGAGVAALFLGTLGPALFSASLIPAGYVLANSAFQNDSPALSGLKGSLTLGFCWLLLVLGTTVVTDINPVTDFLTSLDQGIEEALTYYRQSGSVEPDTLALLEQSFYQMKTALPKVIPSMIAGLALLVTWFSMLAGNRVVTRFTRYRPWQEYRSWQLPEKRVWGFIVSAVLALLPLGMLRIVGVNALIVFSFIYFFQGFSILAFYLQKWNVPIVLRAFFYGMMLFQSFGTVLLLAVGLGDVWCDFRRLRPKASNDEPGAGDE